MDVLGIFKFLVHVKHMRNQKPALFSKLGQCGALLNTHKKYFNFKNTPCGAILSTQTSKVLHFLEYGPAALFWVEKIKKYPIFQNMVARRSFEYKALKLSLGKHGNAALFRVNEEGYE